MAIIISHLAANVNGPKQSIRPGAAELRYGVKPLLGGRFWASLPYAGQFITRPRWVLDYLADGAVRVFPNVELPDTGPLPCVACSRLALAATGGRRSGACNSRRDRRERRAD